jgi:hypothetical protein
MRPDRIESWWELAGPLSLLDRIVSAISKSERVIAVECPIPRPEGLQHALERHLGRELALDCIRVDLSTFDQSASIAHLLGEAAGIAASEIAEVSDLTRHAHLADKVILIDGIDRRQATRWGLFLRSLASEKIAGSIIGPVAVMFPPCGLGTAEKTTLYGSAFTCSALGRVDRHDSIAHLARIGIRPTSDLPSRIGHAVIVEVAAWSRPMLENMAQWGVDDQIEPVPLLRRAADGQKFPYPRWENGLVDLWDDEPVVHPVAALTHGLTNHVQRRVWSAQAGVVLPFVDRIRRGVIQRYREILDRHVSPRTPFKRLVNEREIVKTQPEELEFFEIIQLLDNVLSPREKDLIKAARHARDYGAHMKPLTCTLARRLSEHFEANRDNLECDIPDWMGLGNDEPCRVASRSQG